MFKKTKVCKGLMLAFGGTLALGALPALAQQQLEKVEITGSSIRRIGAETALPVTVIKVEELSRKGVTSTEQAVSYIASNQSKRGDRRHDRRQVGSRHSRSQRAHRR
jgi:iron complex outermembrane receptor protein